MRCKYCGDHNVGCHCDLCDKDIFGVCLGCHLEVVHDVMPVVTDGKPGVDDSHFVHEKQWHGENSRDNR